LQSFPTRALGLCFLATCLRARKGCLLSCWAALEACPRCFLGGPDACRREADFGRPLSGRSLSRPLFRAPAPSSRTPVSSTHTRASSTHTPASSTRTPAPLLARENIILTSQRPLHARRRPLLAFRLPLLARALLLFTRALIRYVEEHKGIRRGEPRNAPLCSF